jgi:hypothetical protein
MVELRMGADLCQPSHQFLLRQTFVLIFIQVLEEKHGFLWIKAALQSLLEI